MKHLTKIACGLAAATLAFTLMACDDSSSASANGPDNEEISSESNGSDGIDSSESTNPESSAESSAESEGSSSSTNESSASLDDNSSSSMAVTCQALTLECYSATQLCNKGLTEYCVNSSSSAEETCQHVSDVDGGTCQDNDVVLDCATEYIPVYNNCPTGNYNCQPPNYDCGTHPINGFSCDERNEKVYELIVYTRGAGNCLYQCSGGKYHNVIPVAPVGN